ncbi:hypothetical protein FGO68_gene2965 [Halteria grandinella]|uniref:phosphoserine transaminase n=1 Tax=Halteria grandinella TaxID=5974 RepID=A0A8J8NP33_HALGN|nr:hypothetical protein FGO68_gene2965 [Halteria grandinella]
MDFHRAHSRPVYNFSAGPCMLPRSVLQQASDDLLSWDISAMEMSHRSREFTDISLQAESDLRKLLSIDDRFEVFFFPGGATLQFSAIPYNLAGGVRRKAYYLTTGLWSSQAIKEAGKICDAVEVWDQGTKPQYTTIPDLSKWNIRDVKDAAYFHYCDNETVHGVEFPQGEFPFKEILGDANAHAPYLVCDASSNILTREIDWDRHSVVYGGTQKNVGPAGACITIIRRDLIDRKDLQRADTPVLCDWRQFMNSPAKYHNTPATWSVWVSALNLRHMVKEGGGLHYQKLAEERSRILYDFIDSSNGFYTNPVTPIKYRSRMNVPFFLPTPALDDLFLSKAAQRGLLELRGHKVTGGCRASMYNAMPLEGVHALVEVMKEVKDEWGKKVSYGKEVPKL